MEEAHASFHSNIRVSKEFLDWYTQRFDNLFPQNKRSQLSPKLLFQPKLISDEKRRIELSWGEKLAESNRIKKQAES